MKKLILLVLLLIGQAMVLFASDNKKLKILKKIYDIHRLQSKKTPAKRKLFPSKSEKTRLFPSKSEKYCLYGADKKGKQVFAITEDYTEFFMVDQLALCVEQHLCEKAFARLLAQEYNYLYDPEEYGDQAFQNPFEMDEDEDEGQIGCVQIIEILDINFDLPMNDDENETDTILTGSLKK